MKMIRWTPTVLMIAAGIWMQLPNANAQVSDEAGIIQSEQAPANGVWLESLNLNNMNQDYGNPHKRRSIDNNPLTLGGTVYPHGIGSHAKSELSVDLKSGAKRFLSMVGVDDERKMSDASVTFQVFVDGKKAADTGVMRGGQAPKLISVDLTEAKRMVLTVGDADDGITNDHADWAGAIIL